MGGDDSPDNGKTPRVSGIPKKEQLDRAKKKFPKYDREANTEYERLVSLKKAFTPYNDTYHHAVFHHLCNLRIQGENSVKLHTSTFYVSTNCFSYWCQTQFS